MFSVFKDKFLNLRKFHYSNLINHWDIGSLFRHVSSDLLLQESLVRYISDCYKAKKAKNKDDQNKINN